MGPSLQPQTPESNAARRFVWTVYSVCTVAIFWFVANYSSDVPWGDDYSVVAQATGHEPVTLKYLWSQHNEHRVPLVRLSLLATLLVTGNDFQMPMYLNAAILSLLALGTVCAARRLRGRTAYQDAFFPLVWLNWGQVEILTFGFCLHFVLVVVLATPVLLIVVRDTGLRLRDACLAGACLLLLPLCGGQGLIFALPLTFWLGYAVHANRRNLKGRGGSLLALCATIAPLILCVLCFAAFESPAVPAASEPETPWTEVAWAFLSAAFGREFEPIWRLTGTAMALLLGLSGAILVRTILRNKAERVRATGLLFFLGTAVMMAVAVGRSRASWGIDGGLQSRYTTLLAPSLCAIFFTAELYLRPTRVRTAEAVLCLASAVAALANIDYATEYGGRYVRRREAFCRDLEAGWPVVLLVREYHHHPFGLLAPYPDELEKYLFMLHDAKVGRFAGMNPDRCVQLRLSPANSTGVPGGIQLAQARKIYAIVLHGRIERATAYKPVVVGWHNSRWPESHARASQTVSLTDDLEESIVWVDDEIDEIRFFRDTRNDGTRLMIYQVTLILKP